MSDILGMINMDWVFKFLLAAMVILVAVMLPRVFQGPTVYDRLNGLGVIGADTISYAILGFISSVIIAKYLGGKKQS